MQTDVTDKSIMTGAELNEAAGAEIFAPGDVTIFDDATAMEQTPAASDKAKLDSRAKVSLGTGLWLVIIGTLLMRVGGAAVGLMLQLFTANIALSAAVVGVVGVSFYLSELFGAPYFGAQMDKQGWRPYLLIGPLLGAAGVLLTAVSGLLPVVAVVVPLLFLSRLLGGLSTATNTPASLSYLSAAGSKDAQLRSRSVGYFELAVVGGTALGGLLGGMLWDYTGQWGFVALAVLYVLTWVMLRAMPHDVQEKPLDTEKHNPLGLLKSRTLWEFAPAWIAVNALYGVLASNAVRMLADKEGHFPHQLLVGLLPHGTGYLFGILAIVLGLGILVWTRILPHMRSSTAMVVSLLGAGLVCALLFALNHQPAADGAGYWLMVGALVLGFLILSGFTPAALSVLVQVGEKNHTDRGAVMGAYSVLLGVGQFLGGAIGGFAATAAGFDGLITLTVVFVVVSLGTMIHWRMVEHNY